MPNFKLTIEYDGTNFYGFQSQVNGERTVQEELQKVAQTLFKTKTPVIGSGRTDRGVHAKGQVINFKADTDMDCPTLLRAFNANLPDDIAVLNVEEVPEDFHSRFGAKSKTYRYVILNRAAKTALQRHYCCLFTYQLNLEKMKEEAQALLGTHDFFTFQASHPEQKEIENPNTTRTITRVEIQKQDDLITIDIEGNGFLYKMVRNIVGTLLSVGSGKSPQGSIKKFLREKDKSLIPMTAKAHGLFLLKVCY